MAEHSYRHPRSDPHYLSKTLVSLLHVIHPSKHLQTATHLHLKHLHIFANASFFAYGAVAYLMQDDQVVVVMSRSRDIPVNIVTLS